MILYNGICIYPSTNSSCNMLFWVRVYQVAIHVYYIGNPRGPRGAVYNITNPTTAKLAQNQFW